QGEREIEREGELALAQRFARALSDPVLIDHGSLMRYGLREGLARFQLLCEDVRAALAHRLAGHSETESDGGCGLGSGNGETREQGRAHSSYSSGSKASQGHHEKMQAVPSRS